MQVINDFSQLPTAEGEWILSTMPDNFVIVLKNDTELFSGYARIAVLARVGERQGDSETDPEKGRYMVHINGFREVEGHEPGDALDNHPDVQAFCRLPTFEPRLTAALNLWVENITEDQKMAVWMAGNPDPLSLLASILG